MSSRADDMDAALAAAYGEPSEQPAREAWRRSKAERRMMVRADDGRRKRATGRNVQFNVKMKRDVKEAIAKAAHKAGVPSRNGSSLPRLRTWARGASMPRLGHVAAYLFAGVPAVIGVAFVARYAYVTSDTAIDSASNAFLFAMIAVGAFAGPAMVIAVGNAGRKRTAWVFGFLKVLAIVANWTHTLGAIAQRGAGTEAANAKARSDVADDRKELARLERALADLGRFTPTDADAVAAARAAVEAAERSRKAECGNGDLKQRGPRCVQREADEAIARTVFTTASANKATTDKAAKLDTEAAAVRARLAKAPACPSPTRSARRSGASCTCPPPRRQASSRGLCLPWWKC